MASKRGTQAPLKEPSALAAWIKLSLEHLKSCSQPVLLAAALMRVAVAAVAGFCGLRADRGALQCTSPLAPTE